MHATSYTALVDTDFGTYGTKYFSCTYCNRNFIETTPPRIDVCIKLPYIPGIDTHNNEQFFSLSESAIHNVSTGTFNQHQVQIKRMDKEHFLQGWKINVLKSTNLQ